MAESLMLAMWQSSGDNNMHLLTICIVLITVAMVLQAIVIAAAGLGAMRTQKKLAQMIEELRSSATPFIAEARGVFGKTGQLIDDLSPSVRTITRNVEKASGNAAATSDTLRAKVQELDLLTAEIQQRTTQQVRRVDGMVTGGLTAASEIGSALHRAIMVPVRELNGLVNGLKAGIDSLTGRSRQSGVYPGGRREPQREEETRL